MTLDQTLAALSIILPLAVSMLGMHIQNLLRGDRLLRTVRELQTDFADHNKRVKKLRRRLRRICKGSKGVDARDP